MSVELRSGGPGSPNVPATPTDWANFQNVAGLKPRVRPSTVVVFWHVGLLMVLGYGYQQIRLMPPQGIPISELLLVYLLALSKPWQVLPKLGTVVPLMAFLGWVGYGMVLVLTDVPANGYRALRDGTAIFEALFLYVGFMVAGRPGVLPTLARWLPWLLGIGLAYALLEPFRETLLPLSPVLPGVQGQPVPVLFTFTNITLVLAALASYSFATGSRRSWMVVGAATIVLLLAVYASRTVLLTVFVVTGYALWRSVYSAPLKLAWALGLVGVLAALTLSIGVDSRHHGVLAIDDYFRLAAEIVAFEDDHADVLLSSGNELRLYWWQTLLREVASTWHTLLFGLGYGVPLTDFHVEGGVRVFEPHNTVIGVLARAGVVGAAFFVWLHGVIVWRSYQVATASDGDPVYGQFSAALLFVVLGTLISSIGQSPFIMPMYAVPYYFFAGVLLRMNYNLRTGGHAQTP